MFPVSNTYFNKLSLTDRKVGLLMTYYWQGIYLELVFVVANVSPKSCPRY